MSEPQAAETTRAFTTWSDLRARLLDDLASGAWRTLASYSLAGRTFSYRSLDDFLKLLAFVEGEMAKETGVPLYRRRTFARQGGRC